MTKANQKIALYVLFGGIATLINIVSYTTLRLLFHAPIIVAYVIAWFLAVLYAFWSNRKAVFESTSKHYSEIQTEFIKFSASRISTALLGMLILSSGLIFYNNDLFWNIIQNIIVIIANYILSKKFVFSRN